MIIKERTEEYHDHQDGTCIYTWVREINNKKFFFTTVSTKNRAWCVVSKLETIAEQIHTLGGTRGYNATQY